MTEQPSPSSSVQRASASEESTSYPTAEEAQALTNEQLPRITWHFRQPLETAITVLDDAAYPLGPSRPYHQPSEHAKGHYNLHEISQESITVPPVSSINVSCEEWDAWHSMVMLEFDPDEVIKYDDEDYPPPSPILVVTASSEKGYVTVHDYITQLWPWLFKHRYMIIKSVDPDEMPQALEKEWVIDMTIVGLVVLSKEKRWPEQQKNRAARIIRAREGKKLPWE